MAGRSRREEIGGLLKRREREGLTYREIAEEAGVSARTLSWWAWRLRREAAEKGGGPELVEVVPRDPCERAGAIEILLPRGGRVRVERGFDEETLGRLMRVLEERC